MQLPTDPFFGAVILAVDDSPDDSEILAEVLIEHGFEVHTANSGAEALEMLPSVQPDLILTDMGMPVMDGIELCRAVHRNPRWTSTPIIFITGFDDQVEAGFKAGASDYICKPFRPAELLARVRVHLAKQSAMAVLAGQERRERMERVQSEQDRERMQGDRDQALMEAHLARREALAARDRIRSISSEKSRFLAQVSQAMRTPLNAMMGFSELLEGDNLDAEQREYLGMLSGAAQELSELVEEMLDYAECADGQSAPEQEPFDPRVVLERAYASCRATAINREIPVECRLDPTLQECFSGSPDALFKATRELLSAALHQAPAQRSVRLASRVIGDIDSTQRVRIIIDADGLHLPEDVLGNLRETRWTGTRISSDTYANLGMRYALAANLASVFGGIIGIEIGPAGGTRFWLEFDAPYDTVAHQEQISA